jgi:hypothetical protein
MTQVDKVLPKSTCLTGSLALTMLIKNLGCHKLEGTEGAAGHNEPVGKAAIDTPRGEGGVGL